MKMFLTIKKNLSTPVLIILGQMIFPGEITGQSNQLNCVRFETDNLFSLELSLLSTSFGWCMVYRVL